MQGLTANNVMSAEKLFPADPAKTALAREIVEDIISKKLPIANSLLALTIASVTRRYYAQCFPTYQVQLPADRIPVLGVGPDFVCSIDRKEDNIFCVVHEAYHLIFMHLGVIDPVKLNDQMYTMSIEAMINWCVSQLLKRDLPTVDGETTGVDPVKFFEWFKKSASEAGLTGYPRKIEEFYRSDDDVYNWVSQLPKPKRPGQNWCNHDPSQGGGQGQGEDGQGEGDFSPVLDQEAVSQIVQKALDVSLRAAVQENNKAAKEELKQLISMTQGNETAERIFGDMGAFELLGVTSPEKRTRFWDKMVARAIASLVKPGDRLAFNRKLVGIGERRFSPRGKVTEKSIVVAIDTSGSMVAYGDALTKIREMVGRTKAKTQWLWFDGEVWPFKPGDEMRGGGGTNCELVEHWIQANCRRYPDAVVVVTDGEFRHFTPANPKRWVWVITRHGDPWPSTHEPRMKVTKLPF
jgi:hypothetical protein